MWTILIGAGAGLLVGLAVASVFKWRRRAIVAVVGALAGGLLGLYLPAGELELPAVSSAEEFEQKVVRADKPVVVTYYTDACPICHKLAPTMQKLAGEYAGRLDFLKLDAAALPELAERANLRGVPTVILFVEGQERRRWDGDQPAGSFRPTFDEVAPAG